MKDWIFGGPALLAAQPESWGQLWSWIEKIESVLHPYHGGNTLTCLSLCKCRPLARQLLWQLLCWDRNVNCVPRGAGMWVWVKWTHADIIYYWPADMVIFFLMRLSDQRCPCWSQGPYSLGEIIPRGIDVRVYCFLAFVWEVVWGF